MNGRSSGFRGFARGLPGIARNLGALAGRAEQVPTSSITTAQLARLQARFPGWRIARTASGTFRARHSTGARLHGRTAEDLENQLLERLGTRAVRHR